MFTHPPFAYRYGRPQSQPERPSPFDAATGALAIFKHKLLSPCTDDKFRSHGIVPTSGIHALETALPYVQHFEIASTETETQHLAARILSYACDLQLKQRAEAVEVAEIHQLEYDCFARAIAKTRCIRGTGQWPTDRALTAEERRIVEINALEKTADKQQFIHSTHGLAVFQAAEIAQSPTLYGDSVRNVLNALRTRLITPSSKGADTVTLRLNEAESSLLQDITAYYAIETHSQAEPRTRETLLDVPHELTRIDREDFDRLERALRGPERGQQR